MHNESLLELINRFVSYKRANGYQYQTGAYYLKRYARFVMETDPGTAALNKESVEGFLGQFQDTPGSLYNAAAILREFGRYLAARGIKTYLIPSGRLHLPTPVQPYFFYGGRDCCVFQGMRQSGRFPFEGKGSGSSCNLPAPLLLWTPL